MSFPSRAPAARARQCRRAVERAAVTAISALVMAMSAGAGANAAQAGTVSIPATTVQNDLFVAGDTARLSSGWSGVRDLVLEETLQDMYEASPNLPAALGEAAIQQLQAAFAAAPPPAADFYSESPNRRVAVVLKTLLGAKPTGILATALRGVITSALQDTETIAALADGTLDVSSQNAADLTVPGRAFAPTTVLTATWTLAHKNAQFAQARDALWQGASGESVLGTVAQLKANPTLAGSSTQSVVAFISTSGTANVDSNQLVSGASGTIAAANTAAIAAQSTGVGVLNGSVSHQTAQQQAAARAEDIKDYTSAITLLGDFIQATGQPTEAQEVLAVGTAAAKIAAAYNTWSKATQGLGALAAIGSASTIALTGNIVGAIMALVPVFSPQPNYNLIILQQLSAISQQIQQFQQAMTSRFDQVDSELKTMYTKLSGELQSIEQTLQTGNTNTKSVYDSLTDVQNQLVRVETNLFADVQGLALTDLWKEINTWIGYREQTVGHVQMTDSEFVQAADTYYTYATDPVATNAPALQPFASSDLAESTASDNGITAHLAYPLDANFEYFNALPTAPALSWRSAPLSSATHLTNPRWWAIATTAYIDLLLENPNYITAFQVNQLNTLVGEGQDIQAMLSAARSSDTSAGTGSSLFNSMIAYYSQYADGPANSVVSLIGQSRANYLATLNGFDPGTGAPNGNLFLKAGLWGGPDQAPDALPSASTCAGVKGPLSLPANATADKIPNAFALAGRLGVGMLSPSCTEQWVNPSSSAQCNRYGCTITFYAQMNIVVAWTFQRKGDRATMPALTLTWTGPREVKCVEGTYGHSCGPSSEAPYRAAIGWTAIYKPGIEQSGTASTPNTAEGESEASHELAKLQSGYYDYVVTGQAVNTDGTTFTVPSSIGSLSSGALQQAAVRLQGASEIIQDFVTLALGPALLNDDSLNGLTIGQNRILDNTDNRITNMLTAAQANPPSTDATTTIAPIMDQRVNQLGTELQQYISNPAAMTESLPVISATVDRVALANAALGVS